MLIDDKITVKQTLNRSKGLPEHKSLFKILVSLRSQEIISTNYGENRT